MKIRMRRRRTMVQPLQTSSCENSEVSSTTELLWGNLHLSFIKLVYNIVVNNSILFACLLGDPLITFLTWFLISSASHLHLSCTDMTLCHIFYNPHPFIAIKNILTDGASTNFLMTVKGNNKKTIEQAMWLISPSKEKVSKAPTKKKSPFQSNPIRRRKQLQWRQWTRLVVTNPTQILQDNKKGTWMREEMK